MGGEKRNYDFSRVHVSLTTAHRWQSISPVGRNCATLLDYRASAAIQLAAVAMSRSRTHVVAARGNLSFSLRSGYSPLHFRACFSRTLLASGKKDSASTDRDTDPASLLFPERWSAADTVNDENKGCISPSRNMLLPASLQGSLKFV